MPGISAIGDFATSSKRHASSVLPAEARALSRLIRNAETVEQGVQLLIGILEEPILSKVKDVLPTISKEISIDPRLSYHRLGLFMEQAVQSVVQEAAEEEEQAAAKGSSSGTHTNDDSDDSIDTNPNARPTEKGATPAATMVSDMSSAEETAASLLRDFKQSTQLTVPNKTAKAVWARILESLQLAVCTRTTKTWGRKKIYEVYQLSMGPVNVQGKSCNEIANMVNAEFRSIYHGGGEDESGCRVYCQEYENRLYLQVCIGKSFDYTDMRNRSLSGEKKKKKANEFVIVCEDGSDLLAVTASRAPSGSRFTSYVMTALELVLPGAVKQAKDNGPVATQRVGEWSGTEPLDLLVAAHVTGSAEGRMDHFAATDTTLDPLSELQDVATASLVDRTADASRLQVGEKHGREIAAAAIDGVALVATNNKGTMVNHSSNIESEWKRQRLENLGEISRVVHPRMSWKWTGMTNAASACWDTIPGQPMQFKCGIGMEGSDVMNGLRQMMDLGLIEGEVLPDFVRDATRSVMTVNHDIYSAGESI